MIEIKPSALIETRDDITKVFTNYPTAFFGLTFGVVAEFEDDGVRMYTRPENVDKITYPFRAKDIIEFSIELVALNTRQAMGNQMAINAKTKNPEPYSGYKYLPEKIDEMRFGVVDDNDQVFVVTLYQLLQYDRDVGEMVLNIMEKNQLIGKRINNFYISFDTFSLHF